MHVLWSYYMYYVLQGMIGAIQVGGLGTKLCGEARGLAPNGWGHDGSGNTVNRYGRMISSRGVVKVGVISQTVSNLKAHWATIILNVFVFWGQAAKLKSSICAHEFTCTNRQRKPTCTDIQRKPYYFKAQGCETVYYSQTWKLKALELCTSVGTENSRPWESW